MKIMKTNAIMRQQDIEEAEEKYSEKLHEEVVIIDGRYEIYEDSEKLKALKSIAKSLEIIAEAAVKLEPVEVNVKGSINHG